MLNSLHGSILWRFLKCWEYWEMGNNYMEKNKRLSGALMISGIVICMVWFMFIRTIPFVPSGYVIDKQFLNDFKWLTVLKFSIVVAGLLLCFVPIIINFFREGSDLKKTVTKIVIGIFAVVLLVISMLHFDNFIFTPDVEQRYVVDRYTTNAKVTTYHLRFDDGSSATVTYDDFSNARPGETKYVVYVEYGIIGVFPTDTYTLPH